MALIKMPVARERNFALREKQRGGGEVVVIVTACTKTSRNQKLCLRESGLALRANDQSTVWQVDDKQDDVSRG